MANNLMKLRGKHQLSQSDLAKKIGITKQGLSFNEVKRVSFKVASKAAEVLGENVFAVLGSDALVALPKTEEDKRILIQIIEEL